MSAEMAVWVLNLKVLALCSLLELQVLEEGRMTDWMELPAAGAQVWGSVSPGRAGWLSGFSTTSVFSKQKSEQLFSILSSAAPWALTMQGLG